MAGSVNKAIIVGRLGRDPEIRQTNQGQRLANLNVATSEQWTDRQSGEKRERTEWHRVVIFDDRLVDVAEKHLKKGAQVYLEGQLQTRKFQDQSGQDRYMTEIVLQKFRGSLQMLGDGGQASGGGTDPQQSSGSSGDMGALGGAGNGDETAGQQAHGTSDGDDDFDSDEIPF